MYFETWNICCVNLVLYFSDYLCLLFVFTGHARTEIHIKVELGVMQYVADDFHIGGDVMRCPSCTSRDIGKIGANQYYCWSCFKEFNVSAREVRVYDVAEDGSLVVTENLPNEMEYGTGA